MLKISDDRYGKKGQGIWFYIPRLFVIILVVIALFQILLSMNFSGYLSVQFVMILAGVYIIYLLLGNIQILLEAPHVAQSIEFNNKVYLRLYFGKEITYFPNDFDSVRVYKVSRWMKMSSLLDYYKDNYIITLKDGSSFYLNGCLNGVEEFIERLQK